MLRHMLSHNEEELERLASNNPAMTAPASSTLTSRQSHSTRNPISRHASQQIPSSNQTNGHTTSSSSTTTNTNNNNNNTHNNDPAQGQHEHFTTSDPAGNIEIHSETETITMTKYDQGWRRVVRNFSPSWFSTTMGTGIVSLIFITIPFKAAWLYWFSAAFLGINVIIFSIAFSISFLRYTLYPGIWSVMIHDPTNSLFLGTSTMGFATIIESWIFLCCPHWGNWSVTFAWVLWMIDAVAAAGVTVTLTFILISANHQQSLDRITAAQLLPIASTIVAAGCGAEVAEQVVRLHPEWALGTLMTSYVMWGMSTPLAMTVLVMYYQRLALHKLPPREIIVSSFLPLGPLGMGGYSIMYMGKVAREILPLVSFLSHIPTAGDFLYMMGMMIALIMWGFGLVWLVFAVATISKSPSFPFNMGWWGFTFPLGVFSVSTMQFGIEMPSQFFKVLGTIFGVCVMMLWVVVASGTIKGAWSGKLFYAPCLKNLPDKAKHSDLEHGEKIPQR